MKTCTKCNVTKAHSEFNRFAKSKDGLAPSCKSCKRAYDNDRYRNDDHRKSQIKDSNSKRISQNAIMVRNYLSNHPCVDCGLSDPELLEFDHVRGIKKAGVGRLVQTARSVKIIVDEIEKCEVRCLHCHRKKTIKTLGWYKAFSEN